MNYRVKFIQQAAMLAGAFSANSSFNQKHAESFSSANKKVQHLLTIRHSR